MIDRERINELRMHRERIDRKERAMARAGLLGGAGALFGTPIGKYETGEEIISSQR